MNPGAHRAKTAAANAPGSLRNVSGSKRQQAAQLRSVHKDRKQLDAYIRANGTMSVARRTGVVGGALERLGYTPEQARTISLDAPLNSSMYDDQAIATALMYAKTITPSAIGSSQVDTITGANAPDAIDMPRQAQSALQQYMMRKKPVDESRKLLGRRTNNLLDYVSNKLKPINDKLGDAPVPGGLGGLFFVNLLFLFFAVPANPMGFTRSQLLWLTLVNRTSLPETPVTKVVPDGPLAQTGKAIATSIADVGNSIQTVANVAAQVSGSAGAIGAAAQGAEAGIAAGLGAAFPIFSGLLPRQTGSGGGPPMPPPGPPRPPNIGADNPPPPPSEIVGYRKYGDTP